MAIRSKILGIYRLGYDKSNPVMASEGDLELPNDPFILREEIIEKYYSHLPKEKQPILNQITLPDKPLWGYSEERKEKKRVYNAL
jgi:hypothetical protein